MAEGVEINFWSAREEYGWLSNFWISEFKIGAYTYKSVEHYYQSEKANTMALKTWISMAPSPFYAMRAGMSIRKQDMDRYWNDNKVDIMLKGIRAKFWQNEDLKKKLLATGNSPIHEAGDRDTFWGGRGRDMLGKLLVQVREEIKRGEQIM